MTTDAAMLAELHKPALLARSLISTWIVLYNKATGEIIQVLRQSADAVKPLLSPGVGSCEIPGAGLPSLGDALQYMAEHYVNTSGYWPQIVKKEVCTAIVDGTTLRNVPLPAKVTISVPRNEPRVYDVTESPTVELQFTQPGTYAVTVTSPKFLPGTYQIEAGEPDGQK